MEMQIYGLWTRVTCGCETMRIKKGKNSKKWPRMSQKSFEIRTKKKSSVLRKETYLNVYPESSHITITNVKLVS